MSRKRRWTAEFVADYVAHSDSSDSDLTDEEPTYGLSEEEEAEISVSENNLEVSSGWRFVNEQTDERKDALPEFLGSSGLNPSINIPDDYDDPMFFVNLFLCDELYEYLKHCTNIRAWEEAKQYLSEESDLPESVANWRNVTVEELKKFMGIVLYTGINKKPKLYDYWSKDLLYQSEVFSKPECLSRNRFCEILKYFRLCDYSELNPNDPIAKVRPFTELCDKICRNVYMPRKEIAIDERLLKFKGRLGIRQYIPAKRSRYGIKTYVLCEAGTGYAWSFKIHSISSENKTIGLDIENAQHLSCTERIVVHLARDLLNKGYHIFVDNFYMSVRLAQYLDNEKTLVTGTCRVNRGFPKELSSYNVAVKDFRFARCDNILALKFVDQKSSGKKVITMVDTAHRASATTVEVIKKGGKKDQILRPDVIQSYNKYMGGVDMLDAAVHHYDCARKSYRWYSKYGIHLLQTLHHNAFIVYREQGGHMQYLKFIEKTIRELIFSTGHGRRSNGSGRPRSDLSRNDSFSACHFPHRIEATTTRKRPARRCRMCFRRGKRKETVFFCNDCHEKPALCAEPCFRQFHTNSL